MNKKNILVTGADGFIGKNLIIRLKEQTNFQPFKFVRGDTLADLDSLVSQADRVIHLAGENRPKNHDDFAFVNKDLTASLCSAIKKTGRNIPLIFASSAQVKLNNSYGRSKLDAEKLIADFAAETSNSATIFRLVGVFGKFCKPNYNSVVATYCHNISRNLPIVINDPDFDIELAYVDDVVDSILDTLTNEKPGVCRGSTKQTYKISLGKLADQIRAFKNCRSDLVSERVGIGLTRALYSTYMSYIPLEDFVYDLPQHADERGVFVEMLKTPDCGQFSFFTVLPGITRGSHYHHSKTEKFLVVKGVAKMKFRHIVTGKCHEVTLSDQKSQVMDTIPGWAHDITNIGSEDAIIMLWANEIFDEARPDCIPCEV